MEEQVILRAPPRIADAVRRLARGDSSVNVSLEVLDSAGNFTIRVGHEGLPAKLVPLPTVVETQKTVDHKTYFKSGDVSAALCVYERDGLPDARADSVADVLNVVPDPTLGATASAPAVLDDGLTPPMQRAVRRRFKRATRYISKYTRDEVMEAERVLLDLMVRDTYEHVVEELVDVEDFMIPWFKNGGDNVTIVYEDGVVTDMHQLQPSIGEHDEKKAQPLPPPVIVRPNADGTFGRPRVATTVPADAARAPSTTHASVPAAPTHPPRTSALGTDTTAPQQNGADGAMDGLAFDHLIALHNADDGGGAMAVGGDDFDDGGLEGLPFDVFGEFASFLPAGAEIEVIDGVDGQRQDDDVLMTAEGHSSNGSHASLPLNVDAESSMARGEGVAASEGSRREPAAAIPPAASTVTSDTASALPAAAGGAVSAAEGGAAFTLMSVDAAPAEGSASTASTAVLTSVSAEKEEQQILTGIHADVAAAEARLAALRSALASKQAQADRTTLPALKNRWLAEVKKLQDKVAQEEANVEALRLRALGSET